MTVQTNTNVASFNGNGVTQIFPIAFKFNNDTDLVVLLVDDDTGAATTLTLNSDYTVSGEGDEEGGLVNVVVAPTAGQRLKVTRIVDILQLLDLRNQGKFFAEVHEDAFDLLTMIAQQHQSEIASSIRVAESDPEPARLPPAASRANMLMAFDASGNPIASAPASGDSADLAISLADSVDPAKGAGLVGYKGGTVSGALDSTLAGLQDLGNLIDHGAVGDGVADDTAAIQAAIDSGLPVIDGRGRSYKVSASLNLRGGLHFKDATIDVSGMAPGAIAMLASGSVFGTYSPTSTMTSGSTSTTFSVADAANLAVGDMVRILADNVFDASNTNSKVGEINIVGAVNYSTGVVTWKLALRSTYGLNRRIEKLNQIEGIKLDRVKFIGAPAAENNMIALQLTYAKNCVIEQCSFSRFDSRGVYFLDSVYCHVRNSYFRYAMPTSSGYGVSFADATQDCTAIGNSFEDVRHSLSTNNTSSRGGVPRRIVFHGNTVTVSARSLGGSMGGGDAIDSHGAAQDISITGNTVIGATGCGINFEASGGLIADNIVVGSGTVGINVHNESDVASTVTVANNQVSSSAGNGIYVFPGIRGTSAVDLGTSITGNVVTDSGGVGIAVGSSSSPVFTEVSVTGNTVRGAGNYGMFLHRTRRSTVSGNSVSGLATGLNALRVSDTLQFSVTGNVIAVANAATVPVIFIASSSANATSRGTVTGNIAEPAAGTTTGAGIQLDNNCSYVGVWNNVARGTTGIALGTGTGNVSNNNIT